MLKCIECDKVLVGNQKKYCSQKCKNKNSNNRNQNYLAQQKRGQSRKRQLIDKFGGACELCGYSKNTSALCFHHIDPAMKSFQIDLRKCSNSKLGTLIKEAEKCQLLCHNCHAELHNPNLTLS